MRVGHGFDIHRLEMGGRLVIGGVHIPWSQGLVGHSDADVLAHAICDALLGAAGLGDIGHHFPDHDRKNKCRNSREFLRETEKILQNAGYRVHNIDSTVLADQPKLAPYLAEMETNIQLDLGASPGTINVKATTTEGLGSIGRGEGIAAFAVALIEEDQGESNT